MPQGRVRCGQKKRKKKIRVFENFKIPLLAYALMDLAGIWTIPLVFYAGHFKPQGRVRCGKKNLLKYFHFQEGQKSGKNKLGQIRFFSYFILTAIE